ncbi:hypothetical protein RB195_025356 [Necator americanus]|uniref:Uncharacterized protein n=1 Tax=Necator americanus TaxID=51031 RepID=A0ABR1ERZ3_NECAM
MPSRENADEIESRVRYTDGPPESSAGHCSRTSSTSLTKLENILDDNGEVVLKKLLASAVKPEYLKLVLIDTYKRNIVRLI